MNRLQSFRVIHTPLWSVRALGQSMAVAVAIFLSFMLSGAAQSAPGDIINCTVPMNISNSPGYHSVDPFLLADPAGMVHLFWAERQTGSPNESPNVPDTLMYSRWNGSQWSRPIDIHISPPRNYNKRIASIRGLLDENNIIHLVWIGPDDTFYYSTVHADLAASAQAWSPAYLLGNDQTGTQYSVDIAYEPPSTLHIAFGRSQRGVNRTVAYIRSEDGGLTWSEPVNIFTFLDFERGASNLRLYIDSPNRIYATWTAWDTSGRGQAIYFARSLDSGLHWEQPVQLAETAEDEYERNWTNLAVLGEDHLLAFWEGGFRAYPQAQYSYDGGVTWTEEIDTLFWLIADNGYAEFVRDSAGRLHLFVARRLREGYTYKCDEFHDCVGDGNAIWHSIWEGGPTWREPKPLEHSFRRVNYIAVTGTGGNGVSLAWFDYTNFEIDTMHCEIADAPPIEPEVRPTPTPQMIPTPTPTPAPLAPTPTPVLPVVQSEVRQPEIVNSSTQRLMLSSVLPAFTVVMLVIVASMRRRRH